MNYQTHGVNNGQAIKEGGVRYRLTRNVSDALSSQRRMDLLDKYHGMATGIFSCDEHLAGKHPSHGTELCTATFPIISDRFSRVFHLHPTPHAPCAMLYLVPMLVVC